MDMREVLTALANGESVAPVFGLDRPIFREALAAALYGIVPTEGDIARAAYGYGNPRRIAAYRAGRELLRVQYNTVYEKLPLV